MSVLLEGSTEIKDDEATWSGMWQFAKDKKAGVSFKYQVRCLTTVSKKVTVITASSPLTTALFIANYVRCSGNHAFSPEIS